MEKRAVIYIRVSDPSQIEGHSLETQEKICRDYIKSKGYEVVKTFREEGESAKHVYTRTQLSDLIRYCSDKKNNISYLVVYKMDRLSRNMSEGLQLIAQLASYGVFVYSATEQFGGDAAGTFLKNVLMAAAQYDNETKGEKVRDNMKASFRDGFWPFKCPIGYKRQFKTKEENKGKVVIPHPGLAPIISRMFQKASRGIYTKAQLARIMNEEGFGDYYRKEADHKTVRNILTKSFYYGKSYAAKWKEEVVGKHEPITDEETWQKAYHYLILKKKNFVYQNVEHYPLKGFLKCDYCRHTMTTSPSMGGAGIVYYYECKKKFCRKLRINSGKAHEQFNSLLKQIQPTQQVIKLFQYMVFSEWDKTINMTREQGEKLDKKIDDLNEELKSIRKAKDEGLYTVERAIEEAKEVNQKLVVLQIERSDVRIEQYNTEIVKEFTNKFFSNLSLLWDNLDLPKRQALLQKMFTQGIICGKDKKIRTDSLAPSFKLIDALASENGENVTPPEFESGSSG